MLHLLKYHLKINLRDFNVVFWPLIFPILLGTLFYFSFGTMKEADFEIVPVAVVKGSGTDNGQSDEVQTGNLQEDESWKNKAVEMIQVMDALQNAGQAEDTQLDEARVKDLQNEISGMQNGIFAQYLQELDGKLIRVEELSEKRKN